MSFLIASLIVFSCIEVALFVALVFFYKKVQTSEKLLANLYKNQETFIQMLTTNSSLEQDFSKSFEEHIERLSFLDAETARRIAQLEKLLSRADSVLQSPEVLRETILQGLRQGITKEVLSQKIGVSIQEIEFIAEHNAIHGGA